MMKFLTPSLAALAAAAPLVHALRDNCADNLLPSEPIWESTVSAEWAGTQVALFPESISFFSDLHPLGPTTLETSVRASVKFAQESYMNITFFHEGAGYRNQFGIYDVDSDEKTLLFPDLSFYWPGCMETGDTMTVGPFPAGSHIGFYLTANGFNGGTNTYYTDASKNPDGETHVVTVYDTAYNALLVGIEDLFNLGDEDYNDALFMATILEAESNGDGTTQPATEAAELAEALDLEGVVVTEAGTRADCVSAPTAADFDVSPTGSAYRILDGRSLDDIRLSGQVGKYTLPEDWAVPVDTHDLRSQVPQHWWGATCVAFVDGIQVGYDLSECEDALLNGGGAAATYEALQDSECISIEAGSGYSIILERSLMEGNLPSLQNGRQSGEAPCTVTQSATKADGSVDYENQVYECVGDGENTVGFQFGLDDLSEEARKYGFRVCADFAAEDVSGFPERSGEIAGFYVDVGFADESFLYGTQSPMNTGTHDAERICIDAHPSLTDVATQGNIDTAFIHFMMREKTGTMTVSNISIEQRDGNLLMNPQVTIEGDVSLDGESSYQWADFGDGYDLSSANGRECLLMTASDENEVHGAEQIIVFDTPLAARAIYIGGAALASSSGVADRLHAVYADVTFDDGTVEYGIAIPMDTDTNGEFKYFDGLHYFTKDGDLKNVARINFLSVFSGHSGSICTTDFEVRLLTATGGRLGANSHGDPHYESLSGATFDVQTVGEFSLYNDGEMDLQVRHAQAGNAAIASGVAMTFHGSRLSVLASSGVDSPRIFINDGERMLEDGQQVASLPADEDFEGGFSIRRHGGAPGQENAIGQPLEYVITARSDNNEAYIYKIRVFRSEFDVQYFAVEAKELAPSKMSSATGLWTLTEEQIDAAAGTGRKRQSTDDAIHRILAPLSLVTEEINSAFKYFGEPARVNEFASPSAAYDEASVDRYLNAAAAMTSDGEAYLKAEAACHKIVDSRKQQCIQDVILTNDSSFSGSYSADTSGATAALTASSVSDLVGSDDSNEAEADGAASTGLSVLAATLVALSMLL